MRRNHKKLPISLQLFARHIDETTLLRVREATVRGIQVPYVEKKLDY